MNWKRKKIKGEISSWSTLRHLRDFNYGNKNRRIVKMSFKVFLGWFLVVSVFAGIFWAGSSTMGFKTTALAFIVAILVAAAIVLGLYLIDGKI